LNKKGIKIYLKEKPWNYFAIIKKMLALYRKGKSKYK
jgi:hypothetical protein